MTDKDQQNKTSEGSRIHQAGPGDLIWSLWAVWTIIIFVITMLLFLIPFLLFCYFRPDPQKTRSFIRMSRVWMNVFLPLAGRLTVSRRLH